MRRSHVPHTCWTPWCPRSWSKEWGWQTVSCIQWNHTQYANWLNPLYCRGRHDAFPHWCNFNHFSTVSNITFSDGNKFLDISKVSSIWITIVNLLCSLMFWFQQILFTMYNVITKVADPTGYALLQCIACYLQYHLYISLDVHMESMLEAGETVLSLFQEHLDIRSELLLPH